jgi:ATP-dependent exoDNAse (exonuclease V) beta subunit
VASQAPDAPPGEPIKVEIATPGKAAHPSLRQMGGRAAVSDGRRFGVLVHGVLRDVSLDGDANTIRQLAELHGRLVGAPGAEIDAACEAIESALNHPLLKRARAAARCHREYPVTLKLDSGKLFEGAIDLAFVEADADSGQTWTIVDFKTDADLPARRPQYQRQLQWYAHALAQLTGMPATAYLLSV